MERHHKHISLGFNVLWSFDRHQLIAAAAEKQMTNPKATAAVRALLERLDAKTLPEVAVWADRITKGKPRNDNHPETIAFFENWPTITTGPGTSSTSPMNHRATTAGNSASSAAKTMSSTSHGTVSASSPLARRGSAVPTRSDYSSTLLQISINRSTSAAAF